MFIDNLKLLHFCHKPLCQFQPYFVWMILMWFPFKIVSVSTVLYPRWPSLLKIEISSNGQICSILSQNVPKFELYKHNDELFSMYDRIFYELWTFVDFDRLCKLEKRGDEILKKSFPRKLLSQYQPNFAEMILGWPPSKMCPLILSSNQDGRQAQNRKKGGWNFNCPLLL